MEKCTQSDLQVNVKSRRSPRFKAGSDLSAKVNLVDVDFNEELNDDHELFEVKISLSSKQCADETSCDQEM